jgi:hypothetical protein
MLLIAIVGAVLAGADPASAAAPFAGNWLLNKEQSASLGSERAPRMSVAADKKRLRVDYIRDGKPPEKVEYNLDGSMVRKKEDKAGLMEIRTERRLRTREDGSSLLLSTRLEAVGKSRPGMTVTIDTPPSTTAEVWELAEGGKQLRISREGGGQTIVYDRQLESK